MTASSVRLDRSLRLTHSVVIDVVQDGPALVVRPRGRPSALHLILLSVISGVVGLASVLCAKFFLVNDGMMPAWLAYTAASVFWLMCSACAAAGLIVPLRAEVRSGDMLRFERATGRLILPRSGRHIVGSHVRAVLLATGATHDRGVEREHYLFTELFLIVDEGAGEERVPVVLWAGWTGQLRSVGQRLASEIGVPFTEAKIPREHMPASEELRREWSGGA